MARRNGNAALAILLVLGLLGLFSFVEGPRAAGYRAVDITRLVGYGMCIGVGLVGLLAMFRRKPEP
jgi:hypothetical protein